MNNARLRDALSHAENGVRVEALTWAQTHWDEARPVLLAMLTACAKPGDITDREANAAFYAAHLFAGQRDAGALPVICALARNSDCLDFVLGDVVTDHLHRLLAGLCDNPHALETIIADTSCDQFVRVAFLLAWRWLFCAGRIAHDDAWRFLVGLQRAAPDRDDGSFADEWARALIAVDPDAAIGLVEESFATAWIDKTISDLEGLRHSADRLRVDPDGERETFLAENGPVNDIVGLLERWFAQAPPDAPDGAAQDGAADEPVHNPTRDVGRNDACPCGSGRKFKKCCLPALEGP